MWSGWLWVSTIMRTVERTSNRLLEALPVTWTLVVRAGIDHQVAVVGGDEVRVGVAAREPDVIVDLVGRHGSAARP